MSDGSLGLAVGRVDIGDGRRIIAAEGTIVPGIGEELAGLRPSSARIENRCGGLISKQLGRRLQVAQQPLVDGSEQERCPADPVGQGRAVEMDTLAGVDLRLTIERQMVGIFGHEHLGDRRLGGNATLDQSRRCRRLDHDPFAGSAAVAWAAGDEHAELGRNDVEAFGDVLANDMQGMPAAWAGLVLDVDDGLDPRQMGRQRAPVRPACCGALRPQCRSRGLLGRFVSRNALLDLLEAKQKPPLPSNVF